MLEGKKILLGVTGSIAAYKTPLLVRLLVKAGAEVKVITTPAARDFVSPLTLSTLSKNPVLSEIFDQDSWTNHVMLGRWADLMLIAPLSCNTLAKMANGICDNLLLAVYLSAVCPVMVAPAMDEDMWQHPSTSLNLDRILSYGNEVIPVKKGELASGLTGEGRMSEPEEIFSVVEARLSKKKLSGKKVMVTAGPTHEPIDAVRFIGNHSSGKMGMAIAQELCLRGAEVTLIMGPTTLTLPRNGLKLVKVQTAEEMFEACNRIFEQMDMGIMAAAVADYTPANSSGKKIKKSKDPLHLDLRPTKDILKSLGEKKRNGQVLVGFALETDNEKENALKKLEEKNTDLMVLNSLNDAGAGFGIDTNKITIFDRSRKAFHFDTRKKTEVAKDIVDTIIRLYYD